MADETRKPLRFTTQKNFAHRLVLSTLTGRTIHISQIRPSSPTNPGLAPHEISFLRLLEAVTNGSHIEISYTGTTILYKPGLITGSTQVLAPAEALSSTSFLQDAAVNVLFHGPGVITSATSTGDMSADTVRTGILPLYAQFGISNDIELRINKRSNPGPGGKGGGGEVQLVFGHQVRLPKTIHLLNAGRIKKIRGVAYCTGVSASNNARMIEAARGVLNPLTADTYIFSDVSSAPLVPTSDRSNPSAKRKIGLGYGLSLVAESSSGCIYSADLASSAAGGEVPEEIGQSCAYQLLDAVAAGGVVSLAAAPTVLTLMAMGSEDVGRVQLGREVIGSEEIIRLARDLKAFGHSGWGVRPANGVEEHEFVVSVVGRGVGNVAERLPDILLSRVFQPDKWQKHSNWPLFYHTAVGVDSNMLKDCPYHKILSFDDRSGTRLWSGQTSALIFESPALEIPLEKNGSQFKLLTKNGI